MDPPDQSTAAMGLFADPEIRNSIMEHCEPATLWAVVSASAQSFRDFNHYSKTFTAAMWANLGSERIQAWHFLKAVETQLEATETGDVLIGSFYSQPTTMDIFVQKCLNSDEESIPELGGPLNVLARLARVQKAINTLEGAPIWSFRKERLNVIDPGSDYRSPKTRGCLRHSLWEIQTFCELFNHTISTPRSKPKRRHLSEENTFLRELEIRGIDGHEAANFVMVYTDLFHILEKTYEQHMATVFEYIYVANIDDAHWRETPYTPSGEGGRAKVKLLMMKEMKDRLDAQMLLGLPFLEKVLHMKSNPATRDTLPGLVGYNEVVISDIHYYRDWRPQEYEAFELFPCSDGTVGYHLSLLFRECTRRELFRKPLRRVDFDFPVFTNGYQPPDLGGIEEANRVWDQEALDRVMWMCRRKMHGSPLIESDTVEVSTNALSGGYRTPSTGSIKGQGSGDRDRD